jgi:hypothetical protein
MEIHAVVLQLLLVDRRAKFSKFSLRMRLTWSVLYVVPQGGHSVAHGVIISCYRLPGHGRGFDSRYDHLTSRGVITSPAIMTLHVKVEDVLH